ncbi:MAG: NADH-quinone oxidoreductase subunit NuoE [Nitrospirae bacterium]|nr:NADH-quinone oxidoreductase subunit NuoE [Nitrospirota bacterium]
MRKLKGLMKDYPSTDALLLPALYIAQDEFGHLDDAAMQYVADLLKVPRSKVYGVATYYTMYKTRPTGKHLIQVCTNLSCSLLGADHILSYLENKLRIKVGETTPDNKFTLITVECLGSCGTAPMMQVNDVYYENLTEEGIDRILEELR